MKSGRTPVSSMAFTMAKNSRCLPMQSLKPMGLPSVRSRSLAMNCIISIGVRKALWAGGEITSWPMGTWRISEISCVTLAAGRMPPWPGLAPWLTLISTILTASVVALAAKRSSEKPPAAVRAPK